MTSEIISSILIGAKVIIIIGLATYTVFAAIIVRQMYLMSHVLEEGFASVLKFLTYIHLVGAVAAIFLAFVLL